MFFIFVIANADLFDNNQEQLTINSGFIAGDDWVSYDINLDNINIDVDNNNGIIEYTVQNWDTLLKIAGVFGTTVSDLQKDNGIKNGEPVVGQVLKILNKTDGIIYTIVDKTNVVVFANKYNLNLQDLMTLNYVQDESEIFTPGQEVFLNISKEKAYDLWLLERPIPEIIPKTTITYRPVINKSGNKPTTKIIKKITEISPDTSSDTNSEPISNIISKRTYTKKIKNGFAVGYCTWYAAIISPNIFPYTDETTQSRTFGWDAKNRCANAKIAWFRVGSKPAVGAVIVYSRLRSSAGHVGKVINYYPDDAKMIIRDMNYVGKFVVTERREQTDNNAIKCYIYWK